MYNNIALLEIIGVFITIFAGYLGYTKVKKENWPRVLQAMIVTLPVVIILFVGLYEFFTGTNLIKLAFKNLGETICTAYTFEKCPRYIKDKIAEQKAEILEKEKIKALEEQEKITSRKERMLRQTAHINLSKNKNTFVWFITALGLGIFASLFIYMLTIFFSPINKKRKFP